MTFTAYISFPHDLDADTKGLEFIGRGFRRLVREGSPAPCVSQRRRSLAPSLLHHEMAERWVDGKVGVLVSEEL